MLTFAWNQCCVGTFHGNVPQVTKSLPRYANRYQSNSLINRITVVTNSHSNTGITTSGVYIWYASRHQQILFFNLYLLAIRIKYILCGNSTCFGYLDDILVFPRSLEEHEQHLRALLFRLQRYGVTKFPPRVPDRWRNEWTIFMTALLPRPSASLVTSCECSFRPQAAATQARLHDVLSGPRVKGSHSVVWTPELHKAFKECKASLSRVKLLAHPEPTAQFALVTDASTPAMGAVLQQRLAPSRILLEEAQPNAAETQRLRSYS
jgi:hypothetical protein